MMKRQSIFSVVATCAVCLYICWGSRSLPVEEQQVDKSWSHEILKDVRIILDSYLPYMNGDEKNRRARSILGQLHTVYVKHTKSAEVKSNCPYLLEEIPPIMHQWAGDRKPILDAPSISVNRPDGLFVPGDITIGEKTDGKWKLGYGTVGEVEKRKSSVRYYAMNMDMNIFKNYYYIDLGARDYESSVTWFKTVYPRGNIPLEQWIIHAFEADTKFQKEYASHSDVHFHPEAAYTFDGHVKWSGGFMGQVQAGVEGGLPCIDFSKWLSSTVTPEDFVVLKMDIEGAEYEIIDKMFKDGTISLVDEFFLEAHYEHWYQEGIMVFTKFYSDVVDFLGKLRYHGVCAHEWF